MVHPAAGSRTSIVKVISMIRDMVIRLVFIVFLLSGQCNPLMIKNQQFPGEPLTSPVIKIMLIFGWIFLEYFDKMKSPSPWKDNRGDPMLDPGLINDMTEMLSRSLKPSQIDEIGRLLMRQYNSHEMLGMAPHITVPKRRAAESLISECIRRKNEDKLIKIIIELNESELLGKPVVFE
jgi:hypothetical protein